METELVMEVMETIMAEDMARSLYVVCRLLPPDAKRVFRELPDKETGEEYNNLTSFVRIYTERTLGCP